LKEISFKQISEIFQVSEETVRKRVGEFRNLKMAALTQEEILTIGQNAGTEESADPPSF
jgi:DeoR/GlpR family transcriptional regulator of sugar metabolism